MPFAVVAYIGLGSNLDDPIAQVEQAAGELAELTQSRLRVLSPLYRSMPMGPADQPDFINAVAALETQLSPEVLLDALQALEARHHRQRTRYWGPRTLDLDLLLYGELTIDSERLKVPHPGLRERAFVLYPLADIAPKLRLPDGTEIGELLAQCPPEGLERLRR